MRKAWMLIAMLGLIYADHSYAQGRSQSESTRLLGPDTGFRVFGSVGSGYGAVAGAEYRDAASGGQFLAGGALAYEIPRWVFDLQASWFLSDLSGQTVSGQGAELVTRAALIELSPRIKLGPGWQLGPSVGLMFGADSSFAPRTGASNAQLLAGVRAVYEMPHHDWRLRFWTQLSTDVSISGRQALLGWAGIQIGFPIRGSRPVASALATTSDEIHISHASAERVEVVLDPQKVFFATNSSELKPGVKQVLAEVGAMLSRMQDPDVHVEGHADQRGSYRYNLRLSKKRADSVRAAIGDGGVQPKRVLSQGYSHRRPLDPTNRPVAWARNRRVELHFRNVENPSRLLEVLKPLMTLTPNQNG